MKRGLLFAAMMLGLVTFGNLLRSGLKTAAASQALPAAQTPEPGETPTPDGTPSPEATPFPNLILDKAVADQLVDDLDGDGKIDPGDTISYTISYSNTGIITATNVTLVDNYDENLVASVSNISDEGLDDGAAITWNLGSVGVNVTGTVTFEATLVESFAPGVNSVGNRVTINSSELEQLRLDHIIEVERPEFTLTKEGTLLDSSSENVVRGGEQIQYTLTYENIGGASASNVVIIDDYPENLVASVDVITGAGVDDGGTIAWRFESVNAGAVASQSYVVTVNDRLPRDANFVNNRASLVSDETFTISAEASVPIAKLPLLTIDKEMAPGLIKDVNTNGLADPGDTVQYIIRYENSGAAAATDVLVVDDYEQSLFAFIENIGGNGQDDGDKITWEIGDLAVGETETIRYDATLKETFSPGQTLVTNEVSILSNELETATDATTLSVDVKPTPTPEPTATPVPVVQQAPAEPEPDNFFQRELTPTIFLGILAVAALGALLYVGTYAKYHSEGSERSRAQLDRLRVGLVREGVFLIFIVSAILILAINGNVQADGVISILSAIVGYVFGRATSFV